MPLQFIPSHEGLSVIDTLSNLTGQSKRTLLRQALRGGIALSHNTKRLVASLHNNHLRFRYLTLNTQHKGLN